MNRPTASLDPAYFDRKYEEKLDYWDFETSPYEAAKYAATLAALPSPRYRSAFEIGCSIGVLTALLAPRCGALLSVDVSERALDVARARCASLGHVQIANLRFPEIQPPASARFDLVLVSEVGYYWSAPDLERAQAAIEQRLEPGGHLVLVHFTPFVSDYPLTGDEVHESFLARPGLAPLHGARAERYRLDVLERR